MKRQYVAGLVEGVRVDSQFVLRSKELRLARSGEGFLAVELGDRTGVFPGVLFRPDRLACGLSAGDGVTVRGVVTTYRGRPRISIESLSVGRCAREDALPRGELDRHDLHREIEGLIGSVRDPGLHTVVLALFSDQRFMSAFLEAPSSCDEDHPYVGGLAEHTIAVATACRSLADIQPMADGDLLLASALAHDVGKVDALGCETDLRLTDEGRLVGHVALGHVRLAAAISISSVRPPAAAAARLCHAVLAHHEGPDGSGVSPVTLEATLLREADRTDRACSRFLAATRGALRADEAWTPRRGDGRPSLCVPGRRA